MIRWNMDACRPCDHCGGKVILQSDSIRINLESDERGDRLTYRCEGCGCRWVWGLELVHKGQSCPVHGTDTEHGLALVTSSPWALLVITG